MCRMNLILYTGIALKEKNYHQKYMTSGMNIFFIGIEFSSKDKNISNFTWDRRHEKISWLT